MEVGRDFFIPGVDTPHSPDVVVVISSDDDEMWDEEAWGEEMVYEADDETDPVGPHDRW